MGKPGLLQGLLALSVQRAGCIVIGPPALYVLFPEGPTEVETFCTAYKLKAIQACSGLEPILLIFIRSDIFREVGQTDFPQKC